MRNAGKYRHKIELYQITRTTDSNGFPSVTESLVLSVYAEVKTTKGFTLIQNDSEFEKAYTKFTFRKTITPIDYDMFVLFGGKKYKIEYINNIDEANEEIELQTKEVTH